MSNTWAAKATASAARDFMPTRGARVSGLLYAPGGYRSGYQVTTWTYDPVANAWGSKADMPLSLANGAVADSGGYVFTTRGATGNASYRLDPVANSWVTRTAPPVSARIYFRRAVVAGIHYMTGGSDTTQSTWYADVVAYDPAGDSWTTKASLPEARSQHASAAVSDRVIVAAGVLSAAGGEPGELYAHSYDPTGNSWTQKANLPEARQGGTVSGALNGRLLVFSTNITVSGQALKLYVLNPVADAWTQKANGPTGQAKGAGEEEGGKFYAMLGSSSSTGWNSEYTPDWTEGPAPFTGWGNPF